MSYSYTYDRAGNPTTIVVNGQTDTYTYDNRNRLTDVCYGTSCAAGQITYTYNAMGNRSSSTASSGTTTYTYNADNELASSSGAISTTYTYNGNGERTAAGTVTYSWNAADELKSLTSGGATTTYAYDGDGNRVSSTSGSTTTNYLYDLNESLPTLALEESGSTVLDRYLWVDGLLVSAHVGSSDYYIAHDKGPSWGSPPRRAQVKAPTPTILMETCARAQQLQERLRFHSVTMQPFLTPVVSTISGLASWNRPPETFSLKILSHQIRRCPLFLRTPMWVTSPPSRKIRVERSGGIRIRGLP
jgi:YD repeat-containing protein